MAEPLCDELVCLEKMRPRLQQRLKANRVPPADGEDLLQETFLAYLQHRHRNEAIRSLEAWLFGTLLFKIRTFWRDRTRERDLHASIAQLPTQCEPLPQERVQFAHDTRKLATEIPPRDLRLIWIYYGLELSPKEASRHFNCRPDSVRKLSRRALKRIRRRLAHPGSRI
jgi:RNA polymerase sigma factor (sigma-70 family)